MMWIFLERMGIKCEIQVQRYEVFFNLIKPN